MLWGIGSLPVETVTYLADIGSDGTSNGAIMGLTRALLAALAVILAAGFGIKVLKAYWGDGKPAGDGGANTKSLVGEAKNFAFAEGLLFAVWAIIELVHGVFAGVLG